MDVVVKVALLPVPWSEGLVHLFEGPFKEAKYTVSFASWADLATYASAKADAGEDEIEARRAELKAQIAELTKELEELG